MGMEKVSLVKNRGLKLPPGFRFHPTDEELVVEYLMKKVLGSLLPASFIPEVDVCKSDPWDLPGNLEQERYFFSTKAAKYPNGYVSNRATSSGYWKTTGIDKQIVTSKGNQVVGMKKTLVFYKGKSPRGSRTDWIMHEYRLVGSEATNLNHLQGAASQMENWVLCRVYLKKRGSKCDLESVQTAKENGVQKVGNSRPVFYEFMRKESITDLNLAPACSSSSGSSGVTEVSCNEPDDHQESNCCNSFPYFWNKPQTP